METASLITDENGISYVTANKSGVSASWIGIIIVVIIFIIIIIIIIAVSANNSPNGTNGTAARRSRVQISNATSGTDTLETGGNIHYFATPGPSTGNTASLRLNIPASPLNIQGTQIEIRNLSISPNAFILLVPAAGVTIEPKTATGLELGVGPFPSPVAILFAIGLNRYVRMQ